MRWLRWLVLNPLAVLLLAILLLVAALVLLLSTPSGTRFVLANAQRFVPNLSLQQVEGTLPRSLTVQQAAWQDAATAVTAQHIRLQHRIGFVTPNWQLEQLAMERLHIKLLPTAPQNSGPFTLPDMALPLAVEAKAVWIGELEIDTGSGQPIKLRDVLLRAKAAGGHLDLQQLAAQGDWGAFTLQGKLQQQADGLHWDATLNATRLNPAVFAPEWSANLELVLQSQGRLATDGTPHVAVQVNRLHGRLRDYPVEAKGQGEWDGKLLHVRALDAQVGANRLQAQGTAAEQLAVEWQLDAPRLQELHPKLRGDAKGHGTLRGLADGSQLQVEVQSLSGKLQGYALNAKGEVAWGEGMLALQDVLVEAGGNRVQATGRATEPFDLRWQVDAPDLSKAWQGLAGRLQGAGTLQGSLAQPNIQANLQGSQLRYQDLRLGKLAAAIQQHGERYTLNAQLDDLRQGENALAAASVQGEGSLADHRITAQLNHAVGKLVLTANGGWQNNQWQGSLPSLSLRDTPAGNWDMLAPVRLQASAQAFSSSTVCLGNAQKAKVCAKPVWHASDGLNLEGDLQQVPLAMLKPWLPANWQAAGTVDATYAVAQHGGQAVGHVTLRLPDSSLHIRTAQGKTETLQYANARAAIRLNGHQVGLEAQLDLPTYGQMRADGSIALSPTDGKHQANVRLNAEMPDIAWLERFAPQIDRLKGSMDAALTLSGNLAKPNLTGTARLSNAQLVLPETGAVLDAINLTMQANGTHRATLAGSLRAGEGTLAVNGILSLANLPQWQADVTLQGSQLKLMDTHEVMALVSPDLRIEATPAQVAIGGKVVIPEASINLRELPATASARSSDVVIVGQQQSRQTLQANASTVEQDVPLAIQPNVLIELGDKVTFNGFGLDARLAGKLRVLRTRQDVITEGALDVTNGMYQAYGQSLTIERGRLLFNGPLDNPGLDIRAIREVDEELEVGIDLKGTVKQPESTLFATPQQTQSDTLSYLLTGQPASSLSGDQAGVVMSAIESLGISGGNSLAQRLGGSIGLDELRVQSKTGDVKQSELSMGKRLGAKLYVRYIIGLFDSLQRLALTYQINKRLQLEAQTGLQQSVDLIYKIDTDTGPLGR